MERWAAWTEVNCDLGRETTVPMHCSTVDGKGGKRARKDAGKTKRDTEGAERVCHTEGAVPGPALAWM